MLTTIETPRHSAEPLLGDPLELAGRPVLFATDGSPASLAAASVARELARRQHAEVHVVTVMDTRSVPIPPPLDLAVGIADAAVGDAIHAERIAGVRGSLEAALGEEVSWDIRLALGTPAHAIVHEAKRLHASLIVVGLRQHPRADRVLHDETTLEVIRHAECAVLGIAEGAKTLPVKAVAAVDFGVASLAAARAAQAVLGKGGTIVVAYVPPITFDLPDDGEAVVHRLGTEAALAQCQSELAEGGVTTDSVVLHRAEEAPTAALLLEYADSAKCDLIATGSGRRSRLDRWMLGSVSTEIVRDGRYSVLVAPPQRPRSRRPR